MKQYVWMKLTPFLILCLLLLPIPELFATEHAHVRMLSVLQMIFSKPLEREELLTANELAAIFPNLDEIIDMHRECYCKEAFFDLCLCPYRVRHMRKWCPSTRQANLIFSQ